ncbi:MAG: hypothetical protein OEY14_03330, partial [Myxococcales bacterium]|nr:hypothetical protein [Myxococcales bacterium]
MRHFSLLFVSMCSAAAIGWALAPAPTRAQPPGAEDEAAEDEAAEDEAAEDEAAEDEAEEGEPTLRPPTLEAFDPSGFEGQGEEAEAEGEEAEGEEAEQGSDPGDDASMLEGMLPSEGDPSTTHWVAPQTALTLHGYMRARYEYQDNFFLGRTDILPFSRFVPADRGALPAGGCGDAVVGAPTVDDGACDSGSESLGFVNMRLRLRPTLSL